MSREIRVIVIGAHPDEPDIYAGGLAALYAEQGHRVKFLSLTDGRCGHYSVGGDELVATRKAEAAEAARRLGIDEYEVLDTPDGELLPTIAVRNEVIKQIRHWQADIVVSFHPDGGAHPDNRYAGRVVGDAVPFAAKTPNAVPDAPALAQPPVVLLMPDYSLKSRYRCDIAIDIGPALEKKLLACDAHATQFYEFTPWQAGFLHEVPTESWEDKKAFLLKHWGEFINASDEMRQALISGYGDYAAQLVRYAEPFEIADYGRRPSAEEWPELFPMLGRAAAQ